MSSYFHKGYEHRNSGYGRRRNNSVGFRRRRKHNSIAKIITVILCIVIFAALIFCFIKYIGPFIETTFGSKTETPDSALAETSDVPSGRFDKADNKVYVSQGCAYLMFDGIDKTAVNYAAVINSVSSSVGDDVKIYSMVVPTNTEIGLDSQIKGETNSQKDNLSMISSRLMDKVINIDLYNSLTSHKNEYIYFRTEDCWTSLGAYYAFLDFAELSGYPSENIYTLDSMSENRGIIKNFLGSLYERTVDKNIQPEGNGELRTNADTVEFYKPETDYSCYIYGGLPDTDTVDSDTEGYGYSDTDSESSTDSDRELFSMVGVENDAFGIFPGKDAPVLQIYNHDAWDSEERLLIVKDDYANPMIGYLIPGYNEVHAVDTMLYKGNLGEYINEHEITQVLFLSSISNANNSLYCQRLRDLFDKGITG